MNQTSTRLSRRAFLDRMAASCAVGLLAGCAGTPPSSPAARRAPFRFLVVNDLHHGGSECTAFLAGLVAQMRRHEGVELCLVAGDLADTGLPESLAAVRDAFAGLGVPVYPVPGNHDCDVGLNTEVYRGVFPDRVNTTFTHRGWQFIGFDSTEGNAWRDTRIGAEALAFLESTATRLDREAPTIVFTHFPLAADVHMAPLNTADTLARLEGLNVRAAFGGHFHGSTERPHRGGVLVTGTCCSRLRNNHDGTRPEGYLLCTAHPDGTLERGFIEYVPATPALAPKPIG